MNELTLNFAPTGMIPTKHQNPFVPISVNEIVDDVLAASELGITMVHLHARDEQTGIPSSDPEIFGRIIEGIRSFDKELIVCVSLSGRNVKSFEARARPLTLTGELKPDMASLTLSSLNFSETASQNSPDMIFKLAEAMKEKGVLPELEAFDLGMINYAKYLHKKNLIDAPFYFNLLFSNIATAQADMTVAGLMVKELPENSYWSFAGFGKNQIKMNALAIAMGGGVRVGIEDNIWFDVNKKIPAKNIDLIKRVHELASIHERPIMTAKKMRKLLRLSDGNGEYGLKKAND